MFVIAIKRIGDYYGKPYAKDKHEWEYAQIDSHAGSFSTVYPCFSGITWAEKFASVEDAKEWFNKEKRYLMRLNPRSYDINSVCIQEIVYNEVEKLNP